jgi:hypothetical protein
MDTKVKEITENAIGQAFDAWASQHPSLAGVIDRIELADRVVDRLRDSPEYKAAVESYVQGRVEIDLLGSVVKLAGELLPLILAL